MSRSGCGGRIWPRRLPRIYAHEAVVVVFVSADYAAGDWIRLERHAAFSRAGAARRVRAARRSTTASYPALLPDVVADEPRRDTSAVR